MSNIVKNTCAGEIDSTLGYGQMSHYNLKKECVELTEI
jgi:hypothetical protein